MLGRQTIQNADQAICLLRSPCSESRPRRQPPPQRKGICNKARTQSGQKTISENRPPSRHRQVLPYCSDIPHLRQKPTDSYPTTTIPGLHSVKVREDGARGGCRVIGTRRPSGHDAQQKISVQTILTVGFGKSLNQPKIEDIGLHFYLTDIMHVNKTAQK